MSKSEMVRALSSAQAAPAAARARSTAEAQTMLIERLDRLALDLAKLTEAQATAARQTGAAITATASTAGAEIARTQEALRKTAGEIAKGLRSLSHEAGTARAQIEAQAKSATAARNEAERLLAALRETPPFPWGTAALSAACGLLTGFLLLTALLIWQPGLIQSLYRIAQAIR